jgi:hypothetical protein
MKLKTLLDTPPWDWPEDAGQTFLEALTNKRTDDADRLIAAELAGDLVVLNDRLAVALLDIARHAEEPDVLRAQAAISLGPVLEQAYTMEFDDPDDVPITEEMFHEIQDVLHGLYADGSVPKEVRRRILEAAVRAPQDWHRNAIQAAYSSGDRDWMLTAVFSMCSVRGFDDQIVEALESSDPEIHYEAVRAAGNWGLDAAGPHVTALVKNPATPKPLLLAAIEAVGTIRPQEAGLILVDLAESDDEEIAEAASEAMAMAEAADSGQEEEDDDWVN